jgi:hypothetical protein
VKEQKQTFADITAKFVGKPYSEYGKGPDSYGCLGLCYAFLKELGKTDENVWQYKGLTIDNFMEAWKECPAKLEQVMIEAVDRIGIGVPVSEKLAGDLVILQSRGGGYFPGIYVGNSHVMASYADLGVRVFLIDNEGITVIKARRF